jgi:hypothetical protein
MGEDEAEDEKIAELLIQAAKLESEALQLREDARRLATDAAVRSERALLLKIISAEIANPDAADVLEKEVRYRLEHNVEPGEAAE